MPLFLSADGQNFIYQCHGCRFIRYEPVDPERNPSPFSFIDHCYCGQKIDLNWDTVWAAQESYSRAKKGRT